MKLYFLFIAAAILSFASCKKSDSSPGFTYIINNVQDVTVKPGTPAALPLEVKLLTGTQETVSLAVTGLPGGITASFMSASGTPTFTTAVTFTADGTTAAGDYPIKITGTSASTGTKSYDLVMHVGQASFWMLNNNDLHVALAVVRVTSGNYVQAIDINGTTFEVEFDGTLPSASGAYDIVSIVNGPNQLRIFAGESSSVYWAGTGNDNKKAQVTITNGKIKITATDIEVLRVPSGTLGKVSCNLTEQ